MKCENLLKLFSKEDIIKKYTKTNFGLEFIPSNYDAETDTVQVLITEKENILGQITMIIDDIIDNSKIGILYLEQKKKAYLIINYKDLEDNADTSTISIKDLI